MKRKLHLKPLIAALALMLFWQILPAQTYINFAVNQAPLLTSSAGADQTIITGDTATIGGTPTAVGGTPAYIYSWTPTTNLSSPSIANPDADPIVTTTYVVTITDGKNCTSSDSITITVDTLTGISDWRLNLDVNIFPNPNDGRFVVRINGQHDQDVELRVVNELGQKVMERDLGKVNGQFERNFDLDGYAKGIYFIHLTSGKQQLTRKLIIQ